MMKAINPTTNGNGGFPGAAKAHFGDAIELSPQLGDSAGGFVEFCRRLEIETTNIKKFQLAAVVNQRREELVSDDLVSEEELALRFAKSVILDMVGQGWRPKVLGSKISIAPPVVENESSKSTKEIIRNTHLIGRDLQLKEKSVEFFVKGMERRRLTDYGWHSIFSLMRDGKDLAGVLHSISTIEDEDDRLKSLSQTISPYLQFVEPDKRCEHTGLRLGDIWRYFRHTWVNEYKSVPGRSVMILIRDAAGPNHPVIGIAALGSSVVQHKIRDRWIGWHPEKIVNEIVENPTSEIVQWLLKSVKRLIADIYTKDLVSEGIIAPLEVKKPTEAVIGRLLEESLYSIKEHRKEPQRTKHSGQKSNVLEAEFWEGESQTFLYRSKRCKQLAKILSARKTFREGSLSSKMKKDDLHAIFQEGKVRSAVTQLVRMIKAEHVGIGMMDITVCGAIAPYNALLGGKLVCMLLCSPEVIQHYSHRYGKHTSIIASAMKGAPVTRKPNLVFALHDQSLWGRLKSVQPGKDSAKGNRRRFHGIRLLQQFRSQPRLWNLSF